MAKAGQIGHCQGLEKPGRHVVAMRNQWWILGEANEAATSDPPVWSCRGAPFEKWRE